MKTGRPFERWYTTQSGKQRKMPYWHCCLFDLSCWCEMWLYGAPFRLYLHRWSREYDIPVLKWLADWRHDKIFAGAEWVETTGPLLRKKT